MPDLRAGPERPAADGGRARAGASPGPSSAAFAAAGGSWGAAGRAAAACRMRGLAAEGSRTGEDRGAAVPGPDRRKEEGGDGVAVASLCPEEGAPRAVHRRRRLRPGPLWEASSWIGTQTGRALASSGTTRLAVGCGVPSWACLPSLFAWTALTRGRRSRNPCSDR